MKATPKMEWQVPDESLPPRERLARARRALRTFVLNRVSALMDERGMTRAEALDAARNTKHYRIFSARVTKAQAALKRSER